MSAEPSELELAAGALLAVAANTEGAAGRIRLKGNEERAAELERTVELRRRLGWALLNGEAWTADPQEILKLLQEVHNLVVKEEEPLQSVPAEFAERYARLGAERRAI